MTKKERQKEIKALIEEMTLEEKVGLMLHESHAVERLGIPEYNWWNEALHGIGRAGYATIFPQAIGLAATFDTELAEKEYSVISDEARARYNESVKRNDRRQFRGLTFWTPNINIFRDPRWGRGQETFGEDPCLTSKMGTAAVHGLQGDDPDNLKVAACAKHFAVHSGPEGTRHTANVKPSKKDLWETYLPAFNTLVDENVESVMGAYQRLYDEPCNGSSFLLGEVLRKKWGYKNHVVSDCWAVRDFHENHKVTKTPAESAALAINNGCDLNCGCTYHAAIDAVRQGLLSEEKINESVTRLLETRFKLGMFDSPEKSKWGKLGFKDIDSAEHRALARKVAADSMVLLKNEKNLLPLGKETKKILVMGPGAASLNTLMGNYFGVNSRMVTLLEGIVGATEERPDINMDFIHGVSMYGPSKIRGWTVGMAESADVVIACFGIDNQMEGEQGESVESEEGDRKSIEIPQWQIDYLQAVHERGTPVVLVLTGGSALAFPTDIADAIIYAWYPGEEGGNGLADVIFGKVNPSAHLPVTFPKCTQDLPDFEDYSMKNRTYKYIEKEPLFPFGFGLSYTTFEFNNISAKLNADKGQTVSIEVKNTGKVNGKAVVQCYVAKKNRKADDPICSLRDFTKLELNAGEAKEICFNLPVQAFETITSDGESVIEPGEYEIIISDAAPCMLSQKLGASKAVKTTVKL